MEEKIDYESVIDSLNKKVKFYEQRALAFKTVVEALEEEKNKDEKTLLKNNLNYAPNSKMETESAIREFFHDHKYAATTAEIEKSLKSKGYVGYSKKGLKHSIGIILNKTSHFYCVDDNKYNHLKTYASHSMGAVRKKNGDSNNDITIPNE